MDIRTWGRKGILLCATIALALFGGFVLDRGTAGSPPTAGPQASIEPNVVLSGSYSCAYTVWSYYVGPPGDPNPSLEIFAETTDGLALSTTGGNVPVTLPGPGFGNISQIGPGFGGGRPGGGPTLTATPVSGFGTGHSFNDGSIGCTISDVRRRQPPQALGTSSASASFNLVCEGPQTDIVHDMGELSRAVLALKLQSV